MVDRALNDMRFIQRVQDAFEPEDLTEERIGEWILHTDKPGANLTNKSERLSRELAKTSELYKNIEKEKTSIGLQRLRKDVSSLYVHSGTLGNIIDNKIRDVESEDLKKRGKITTLFRSELKRASSISDIDNILSKAKAELGEGKNYDSLVEGAESFKGRFKQG